ncbi:predicted protein [Nematostella vectensis]|uniref:G-protein coupled receptors family 1 profile domain-containing protein n=1 Tax=Nematostella vectensis TaxID=45351 RepID=A7RND5_NEMVE|nr:predicted protein [Nematostella vectensis]|eukprot:XP_001639184.1 predicted protein [Nematostella vectensis]
MQVLAVAVFAVAAVFGFLGNICVLFDSIFTSSFRAKYFLSLTGLDLLSSIVGPIIALLTACFGTKWLESVHGSCEAIGFVRNFTHIASPLAILSLVIYRRRKSKSLIRVKSLRVIILVTWVIGLAVAIPPLVNWNAYSPQPPLNFLLAESWVQGSRIHAHDWFAKCVGSRGDAFRSYRRHKLCLQWLRHAQECRVNDPGCTTVQSSGGNSSRDSSFKNLLVALANSKNDFPSVTVRHKQINQQEEQEGATSLSRNVQAESSSAKDFTHIRSYRYRKHFTTRLAHFRSTNFALKDKQNIQFLKLKVVATFVSLIGWMLFYLTVAMSTADVSVPQLLLVFAEWLLYVRPVFSPLIYPLVSKEYREAFVTMIFKLKCCRFATRINRKKGSVELVKLETQYQAWGKDVPVSSVSIL